MRSLLVTLAALAVAAAGCSASRDAAASGPMAQPSARFQAALSDSLDEAPSALARRAVAARALARSGVTPLAAFGLGSDVGFTVESEGRPVAAGFIPGRNPLVREELVVLGTDVRGAGVAAVLDVARALAERAIWTTTPERTVQVVLWDGVPSDGRVVPLWPASQVRSVVVVGNPPVQTDSVAVEALAIGEGGVPLAAAVLERVIDHARRPAVMTDSLASR